MSESSSLPRASSLAPGGPFYRLLVRLRLLNRRRIVHCWWLALALWLPIVVGEEVSELVSGTVDPAVYDLSVHARFLVALPLLLLTERLLDSACRGTIMALREEQMCAPDALDAIVDRAQWLRNAWWAEALLLAGAIFGGQVVLWKVSGAAGWVHGGEAHGQYSFSRIWYALVALPVEQFVLYRWLWRWCIWSLVLVRLARRPLAVLATHPDRAGGLGCLSWPLTAFGGLALAVGSVLSGAWGTQLLTHRATFQGLVPGLVAFMLLVLVVAIGPLLLFCGHLFRARRLALLEYTEFARTYTRQFHDKWIVNASINNNPLGTPDLQSLNDLMGAFQVIVTTGWFVFGTRKVVDLLIACVLPMLPLLASMVTVEQLMRRMLSTVVGGLPL